MKTYCNINDTSVSGNSPPDIFIGRWGYPKVFVGPLIPPTCEDTTLLSQPENWIEQIIEMRTQLVRGTHIVNVKEFDGRIAQQVQELALSKNYVYADAQLERKPSFLAKWDDYSQPYGPSAPISDFEISGAVSDKKIEKKHSDNDLKAVEAVFWLYDHGIAVSKIQKAFSAGLFGLEKNRKFVPTRWSITAVDDTIGKKLLQEVKQFDPISDYRIYQTTGLDNRWIILMMPQTWCYELMEAWYPGTIWNPEKYISIYSSSEGFEGRKTYAEIGGCYYAARLAVAEHLRNEKKQASVVIMRESHPGYIMPVGVWNVREHVREALKNKPIYFDSLDQALNYASTKLDIPISQWIRNSDILSEISQKENHEAMLTIVRGLGKGGKFKAGAFRKNATSQATS